jgi:hypothetical protein
MGQPDIVMDLTTFGVASYSVLHAIRTSDDEPDQARLMNS